MANKLKEWFDKATEEERNEVAALALTTVETLRITANAYKSKKNPKVVDISPEFAARIEWAIFRSTGNNLGREHMSSVCANCRYQKECNKGV